MGESGCISAIRGGIKGGRSSIDGFGGWLAAFVFALDRVLTRGSSPSERVGIGAVIVSSRAGKSEIL